MSYLKTFLPQMNKKLTDKKNNLNDQLNIYSSNKNLLKLNSNQQKNNKMLYYTWFTNPFQEI